MTKYIIEYNIYCDVMKKIILGREVFVVHVTDEMFGKGSLWKGERNKRRYTFSTLNKSSMELSVSAKCLLVCEFVFL